MFVCDGKTVGVSEEIGGKPKTRTKPAPAGLAAHFGEWYFRLGLIADDEALDRIGVKGLKVPEVTGLKLAGKEKVGDRQAHILEYRCTAPNGDEITCKLWLDAMTNMPLKRVIDIKGDGKEVRAVETYTSWELDPKLPDDTFTLPK